VLTAEEGEERGRRMAEEMAKSSKAVTKRSRMTGGKEKGLQMLSLELLVLGQSGIREFGV
jgi:hypothetical protein